MGLGREGAGASRPPLIFYLYLFTYTVIPPFLLIASILKNSLIDHQPTEAYISATVLTFYIVILLYRLYKYHHRQRVKPITHILSETSTDAWAIASLLVLSLWGIAIPYLPYMFILVVFNYNFALKNKKARLYTIVYTTFILLNSINILPLILHPELPQISPLTHSAIVLLHLLTTAILQIIGSFTQFLTLNYIIRPTQDYGTDLLKTALTTKLYLHRIRNTINKLQTSLLDQKNCAGFKEYMTDLYNTLEHTSVDKTSFITKLEVINNFLSILYEKKSTKIHIRSSDHSKMQIESSILSLLIELLENMYKHANPIKVELSFTTNKLTVEIISNYSPSDLPRQKLIGNMLTTNYLFLLLHKAQITTQEPTTNTIKFLIQIPLEK